MAVDIGLGLMLNVLFWAVAVVAAVVLGSLAVIGRFPGRERKARKRVRGARGGAPSAERRVEADAPGERYRKAS